MTDLAPIPASPESLSAPSGVYIGGQWKAGSDGVFPVTNPATEQTITEVANTTAVDAELAVDAAACALPAWAATPPRTRSELLTRMHRLMLRDTEPLAELIAEENGKSLADARGEVSYAAEFFRWYAEEAVRPHGDFGPSPGGGTRSIVMHKPAGVAALVTPWNFPAAMATRKLAPALAAGCTTVLKPAAETPLTALAIASLFGEAGLPDGVVNVVPGTDAPSIVHAWLADPRVRKLSFTGSTSVGRTLLRQAADRVVNSSMELGGNAPFIVTSSADIPAAVDGAMVAKFRGGGQACTAANRFYVHSDVVAEFTAQLGTAVEALRVGPAAEGNDIGPLISSKARTDIAAKVDDAVARGATIAHQAPAPTDIGYFYPPTVVTDVPTDATLVQEEIFGPVAPIISWRDTSELLDLVNGTEHGLAAYLYGTLGEVLPLAERVDAGMVGINRGLVSDPASPFGGVKQSGLGREGSRAGIEEYLETQYLSLDWD